MLILGEVLQNYASFASRLPLKLAVGLTMHAFTCSKFIIQMLHRISESTDQKVPRLETEIAAELVSRNLGLCLNY